MADTYSGPFGAGGGGGATFTPYVPTQQIFTSGSGTYIPPTSPRAPLYIRVQGYAPGGGGEGSGQGSTGGDGTTGGNTTFSGPGGTFTVHGGGGGTFAEAGLGGTYSISSSFPGISRNGQNGAVNDGILYDSAFSASPNRLVLFLPGGVGGSGIFPGAGQSWTHLNAVPDTGSGGCGASIGSDSTAHNLWNSGMGGGGGAWFDYILPAGNYAYNIGSKGLGGSSGTGGAAGGDASNGGLIITEYYQ